VLNAGFPNLNVEQERRRLATLLPRVRPDVVVVTFDWWNVPLDAPTEPQPPQWSGRWVVANVEEKAARLGEDVALVHAALRVARSALTPSVFPPSGLARELEPLTLPPPTLATRWARTRAAIGGMAADARSADARFVLVVTPLDVQVDRGRNALYLDGTLPYPSHGFRDIDYRRARAMPEALRAFAAQTNLTLVDLTPEFEASGAARLFLARDYHLAPRGHRLVAREVARWIVRSGACGHTW
jgi:hypothetical protein